MRFGCCGAVAEIQTIADAGYDYVELPVGAVLPESDESEWMGIRRNIISVSIKPEAWNCLLPPDLRVTGPELDTNRQKSYLRAAFRRIADVGGKVVVFGSGSARTVPQGYPREDARHQIIEFLAVAGEIAHNNDIRLAIEPLNQRESNILISVAEAAGYAEELNHPAVGVLADFFHMDEEHEPFSNIIDAKDFLTHIHVADTGRMFPGSGSYPYTDFVATIQSAGYDNRISCECGWGDDPISAKKSALEFLRAQFA